MSILEAVNDFFEFFPLTTDSDVAMFRSSKEGNAAMIFQFLLENPDETEAEIKDAIAAGARNVHVIKRGPGGHQYLRFEADSIEAARSIYIEIFATGPDEAELT